MIEALGENHPSVAETYHNLGMTYSRMGNVTKGLEYYNAALPIMVQALGHRHPNVASVLAEMGVAYGKMGNTLKALGHLQRAVAILVAALGPRHPQTLQNARMLCLARRLVVEVCVRSAVHVVCQ